MQLLVFLRGGEAGGALSLAVFMPSEVQGPDNELIGGMAHEAAEGVQRGPLFVNVGPVPSVEDTGGSARQNHIVIHENEPVGICLQSLVDQDITRFVDYGSLLLDHPDLLWTILGVVGEEGEVGICGKCPVNGKEDDHILSFPFRQLFRFDWWRQVVEHDLGSAKGWLAFA